MSDEIDRANDLADAYASDAIAHSRHALQSRALVPCGACHWCGDGLDNAQKVFCDSACANEYAAKQKRETGRAC